MTDNRSMRYTALYHVLVVVMAGLLPAMMTGCSSAPAANEPSVGYTLTCDRDSSPPAWRVEIEARGLDASARELSLRLEDFGSWTELADYYLTSFDCSLPSSVDPSDASRRVLEVPPGWDGAFTARYTLHPAATGSAVQRSHGLLPVLTSTYSYGCTSNTLMVVTVDGRDLVDRRRVAVRCPPDWTVFSGWAGETPSPHCFEMDHADRNGLIAMGAFTARARREKDGTLVEVRQFGTGLLMADETLDWICTLVPRMSESNRARPAAIRVFLNDSPGGGMMTDRGLVIGVGSDWTDEQARSPYTRQIVAHELFHLWLGGMIRPDERYVWFTEGFTDYLSLRHAAAAGIVPHDWFVRRLVELNTRALKSSLGTVSFVDPAVQWRDGDGPNETMAYAGGHLLAFLIDVELIDRGHPWGLDKLIADLIDRPVKSCTVDDLRSWLESHGAADLYDSYIAGTTMPDVPGLLQKIGARPDTVAAPVAYLGVKTDPARVSTPFRPLRIVDVDPAGPAAAAGAQVDDLITGWWPARSDGVGVRPERESAFGFGMREIMPGYEGTYFNVMRDGAEVKISVTPQAVDDGFFPSFSATPRVDAFLSRPASIVRSQGSSSSDVGAHGAHPGPR
ncbi:MAG: hypothetical protein GIKADHBN_01622 [Phycisphaerales bacterium]|nr:hypothetical protein [Phycisphaerales bacterium]